MTLDLLADVFSGPATASLDEFNATAALHTRFDRKYVVPEVAISQLACALGANAVPLEIDGRRVSGYESLYYDTPDLFSYHQTAQGRPGRFKVRTRTYLDTMERFLEVKERTRDGMTIKHRQSGDSLADKTFGVDGHKFLASFDRVRPHVTRLHPTLRTRYQRAALLLRESQSRVSIDVAIEFREPGKFAIAPKSLVIVETKSPGPATAADHVLWELGHRPVSMSKYATGLAASDPTLPANRWNRVLRRHFAWMPARQSASLSTPSCQHNGV